MDLFHPLFLSSSRIDHLPLPLTILRITFNSNYRMVFPPLHLSLFSMVNPLRMEYDAVPPLGQTSDDVPVFFVPMSFVSNVEMIRSLDTWTRIEILSLHGYIPLQRTFATGRHQLAFLPPPSIDQRRIVRVRPSSAINVKWLQNFVAYSYDFANATMKDGYTVLVMK